VRVILSFLLGPDVPQVVKLKIKRKENIINRYKGDGFLIVCGLQSAATGSGRLCSWFSVNVSDGAVAVKADSGVHTDMWKWDTVCRTNGEKYELVDSFVSCSVSGVSFCGVSTLDQGHNCDSEGRRCIIRRRKIPALPPGMVSHVQCRKVKMQRLLCDLVFLVAFWVMLIHSINCRRCIPEDYMVRWDEVFLLDVTTLFQTR
jgi:hypothetical protein